ncbi:uncharacterized protein LOC111244528 isoform X2 [Varroa destructor]|uniref:Uncharacterized protein n=1 Tax=Varroa destructor TaxID=109461 RepID=A0A7M7JGL4_VARDE|nr:uncharacterized protein LOC111244528 isoform X2 [Varroa destructor]
MPGLPRNRGRILDRDDEGDEYQADEGQSWPLRIRRISNERRDADIEFRSQHSFKLSILCLVCSAAFFVYFGLSIFTWDSILAKPDEQGMARLRQLWKNVDKSLPPVKKFKRFSHYLLHHPAIHDNYCSDLTSVVCETFLAMMPENVSYQDFLVNPDHWVDDFPYSNRIEVSVNEWQPMIEPLKIVNLQYNFTADDLSEIASCESAVRAVRRMDGSKFKRVIGKDELVLTMESAKLIALGACRLAQLTTFKKRADLLWQICMIGCGTPVGIHGTIDWAIICDVFLFMSPDLRALHKCNYFPEAATKCDKVQTHALDWCGLSLQLEEADEYPKDLKPTMSEVYIADITDTTGPVPTTDKMSSTGGQVRETGSMTTIGSTSATGLPPTIGKMITTERMSKPKKRIVGKPSTKREAKIINQIS